MPGCRVSERVGVPVPLVHGLPFGPQIFDLGIKLRRHAQAQFSDFHADFTKEPNLFLQARGVRETLDEATKTSFLLLMSGKGLLMDARTHDEFETGMARAVAVVLRDPPRPDAPGTRLSDDAEERFPAGDADQRSKPGDTR